MLDVMPPITMRMRPICRLEKYFSLSGTLKPIRSVFSIILEGSTRAKFEEDDSCEELLELLEDDDEDEDLFFFCL